jgi:hypothetical protein
MQKPASFAGSTKCSAPGAGSARRPLGCDSHLPVQPVLNIKGKGITAHIPRILNFPNGCPGSSGSSTGTSKPVWLLHHIQRNSLKRLGFFVTDIRDSVHAHLDHSWFPGYRSPVYRPIMGALLFLYCRVEWVTQYRPKGSAVIGPG